MTQPLHQLCRSAWFLLLFIAASYQTQAQVFSGEKVNYSSSVLEHTFMSYDVYRMDAASFAQYVRTHPGVSSTLKMGDHQWGLNLVSSDLLSENYRLTVQTPDGEEVIQHQPNIAFKGHEAGWGNVRLTLDQDLIYGFIVQGNMVWRIEPLWYLEQSAPHDLFVVYEKSQVIPNPDVTCGVTEETEKGEHFVPGKNTGHEGEQMAVYELELAIASDQLMLAKYGSNSAVEAHNIAVINDVEGDYTGSFNHDLCFDIVTQYIATTFPGPWSNSNDAGTLLASFAQWGNGGGFGVNFDLGELWTNRDFTGGTVGIAYLNGICNNNKYHCLQDFTTNTEFLRCMTSHEIGHNFSAVHDNGCNGGEFIMCPFVSASTNWSSNSQNAINAYMQNKINSGCLTSCSQGPPLVAEFEWSPEPGCVGQPVTFTDMSTGVISSWSWVFQGGTPATSSQQNPVVTFNTPGQKNVALVVTGPSGNNASVNHDITIGPLPTANFTYTIDYLTVTFTNTSTNATSYLWEFGDGQESTDSDPVYTYAEAGIYVVKLTATNYCGSVSKTYTINTFPTAEFSAEPTSGCATLTVQMHNESSSNATSYQWQFPGGSPAASNQVNPVVLYTTSGTYTVTLTAYNVTGSNSITKTNYITVGTVPGVGFNFSVSGLTASFSNTSTNATSYSWNFGDGGTSTQTNPTHTYATGGTYTVTLTATNDCGSVTITKTVVVAPPPNASFTTSGNTGCAPHTVQFTNTSSGATSYAWTFPGGNPATSTDANPVVEFANPGVYTVTLTATNSSGSSTATATITVNTTPTAGFNTSTNGSTAAFVNTSAGADSYSWAFGDGGMSTDSSPTHTYAADGVYTVVLTATNACGTSTHTQTVTIITPPTANFTASPTSGCGPLTVQFTNNSSANATTFSWTFPGGTPSSSTDANPVVVYSAQGLYTVTLIASNSAGSNTFTQTDYIQVLPNPTAGFSGTSSGLVATFTNSSADATSYSWDFGDGNNGTDANPTHTYAGDGVYTVVLTAINNCGTATATQSITIITPPIAGFTATPTTGCAPLTVQYTNTSTSNATSYFWEFEGGTPSTSTEQHPAVVYNAPGVYSVTLTAGNSAGSSTASQTSYIHVGTTPIAGFSSSVTGATATFTNTSTNATSYSWNFGDGGTSSETNPVHTYAQDGTYTVTLTATNDCGDNVFSQSVVVFTDTQAGFTADVTSGCGPLTVHFQDLSSENAFAWTWTFPGGEPATSNEQNPVVVYNVPGTYDVSLVATGPNGSSLFSQPNFITVYGPPTSNFSATISQNVVNFINNSTGAVSYLWSFGDGSNSIEENPAHTYAVDGTYTVILASTNNCGTTIFEQTIQVVTTPIAAFTFNSSAGCAPLAILFDNTSSSNATDFSWVFEGGDPATSTDENPVVLWSTPGVYQVTLTASNSAGSSTATATITVNTTPIAGFTSQTAGLAVVLTNTSTNANSYNWDFGDGNSSTEANPTHTYATTGDYTIQLIATNDCGSTTFVQTVSIVGSAPLPSLSSDVTSGCIGMTVNFTDNSAGNPTGWLWTFPGGTPASSSDQNPVVTYNTPGVYDVTLEVSNAFGSNSATLPAYITVGAAPTAGFNYTNISGTGAVQFTNTSVGGTSFAWNFGDGNTSIEENPLHIYAQSGIYTVTLNASNTCGLATLQQTVNIIVSGTIESAWIEQFQLFPNPNNRQFTVLMSGQPKQDIEFSLFNSLGQIVYSEHTGFGSGTLNKQFDVSKLPAAMYTLRVQADGVAKYVKIAIQ